MSAALVTGVTGQDGGYLVEALQARGVQVHGYVRADDDAAAAFADAHPEVALHTGELDDAAAVRAALEAAAPEQVFHLAGVSSVALSWEQPVLVQRVNALGTATVLEAVWQWSRAHGVDTRFVHASTAEVFGSPAVSPQDESTPIAPTSPYGASKAAAHLGVAVYRDRGLRAGNAILFNHESPRRPDGFVTQKIARAAADIAAGRAGELRLGNLDARRDWGWAPDYVAAMVAIAGAPDPDDFVVATGVAHTVREFVAAAFARVGLDPEPYVVVDPAFFRPVEATVQCGDATRLRTRLGWEPTVAFDDVVARMVDAQRARTAEG